MVGDSPGIFSRRAYTNLKSLCALLQATQSFKGRSRNGPFNLTHFFIIRDAKRKRLSLPNDA